MKKSFCVLVDDLCGTTVWAACLLALSYFVALVINVATDPPRDSLKVEQELEGLQSLASEQMQTLEFKPEVYRLDYKPGDENRIFSLGYRQQEGQ